MANEIDRAAGTGQQSTQLSLGLPRDRRITDRMEDRKAFATAIGPTLALCAPTGMQEDERKTWMAAAFTVFANYPLNLVERVAIEARKVCDHPSKIVPAMTKELERLMFLYHPPFDSGPPLPLLAARESPEERAEREEVGKLMKGLVAKLEGRNAGLDDDLLHQTDGFY